METATIPIAGFILGITAGLIVGIILGIRMILVNYENNKNEN